VKIQTQKLIEEKKKPFTLKLNYLAKHYTISLINLPNKHQTPLEIEIELSRKTLHNLINNNNNIPFPPSLFSNLPHPTPQTFQNNNFLSLRRSEN